MNTKYLATIIGIVVVLGALYVLVGLPKPVKAPVTETATSTPAESPKLAIDLYPLFSGVTWEPAVAQDFTFGTTTYPGVSAESATTTDTMDPSSVFMPFLKYYEKLLPERGWSVANEFAAGGHTGGLEGYRNGSGVILLGFHIVYHIIPADAPSECPCDVTVSLFSNVTN